MERSGAFGALRRFARTRPAQEKCELCSATVESHHEHLLGLATREIVCACKACAILFSSPEAARYRRIPKDATSLGAGAVDDFQWESLGIPIGIAFFFTDSRDGSVVALYPSPAGAVESLLPLDAWSSIVQRHPRIRQMQPDAEALLVNRSREESEAFIVPIDDCFRLVGIVRTKWRGISGGDEVKEAIEAFFSEMRRRCGDKHCD